MSAQPIAGPVRAPGDARPSTTARLRRAAAEGHGGFLRHPDTFPLHSRRLLLDIFRRDALPQSGDIGLLFRSSRFVRPGTRLEISIPLRGETQKFRGEVVMVRAGDNGYEIGLWLDDQQDCGRARLVEQICHIESHLQSRRDRPAAPQPGSNWLTRLAASLHLV